VNTVLLVPALAFLAVLVIFLIQLYLMSRVAWRGKSDAAGKCKAYACGEDVPDHRINPDYSQFFPFAFFFTIMHVVALVLATVPTSAGGASYGLAAIFIIVAITSLFVLFRKEKGAEERG
jgi:NADH:ubiquinone oxidoreductase subunit 3 (subunit A)